jgi:hypothetical protein
LPSGNTFATATLLELTPMRTAHVSHLLRGGAGVDLYRVALNTGDSVHAAVSTPIAGSGLQSWLRVFGPDHGQVALDEQESGDPQLTFQAARAGDYFIGVSSAGNGAYDAETGNGAVAGTPVGPYSLDVQVTPDRVLRADLAGSSFRLNAATAAYGETVSGTFVLNNRGGAGAGSFDVQVVLSPAPLFGPAAPVLATFTVPALAVGQAYSPGTFTVTLPDPVSAAAAGLPISGPLYLGLRIDPAGSVPELNPADQSGVQRGEDWQTLAVVTPVTSSGQNHSQASADVLGDLNSLVTGFLMPGQADWYRFSVSGTGLLSVRAPTLPGSTVASQVALYNDDSFAIYDGLRIGGGGLLISSNEQPTAGGPAIDQILLPGNYYLKLSARDTTAPAGAYALITVFTPLTPQLIAQLVPDVNPGANVAVMGNLSALVSGDFNRDGIVDLAVADRKAGTVTVLLGVGDGSFSAPTTYTVGGQPDSLTVGDFHHDGRQDLATLDRSTGVVTILPGLGDGTFSELLEQHLKVAAPESPGSFPPGSALASGDFNGDGTDDLALADHTAGTVTVFLGVGDGSFHAPTTYAVGGHPDSLTVEDFYKNGRLDLVILDRSAKVVTILPGLGDGTFAVPLEQHLPADAPEFAPSLPPEFGLALSADFNRDGKPDLAQLVPDDLGQVQLSISLAVPLVRRGFVETPFSPAPIPLEEFLGHRPLYFPANGITSSPPHAPPLFADFTDNGGVPKDVITVSQAGDILFRAGRITPHGLEFAPPTLVNTADEPRARAVTILDSGTSPRIAALNLNASPGTISFYQRQPDGTWSREPTTLTTGLSPVAIAAADLDGSGRPDLIVANDLFGLASLSLYVGQADGSFRHLTDLQDTDIKTGTSISNLVVADVNQDGRPDLILTNADAGDVGVFLNETQSPGDLQFSAEERLRAGTGYYGAVLSVATLAGNQILQANGYPAALPNIYFVTSDQATRAVVSGDFTGNGVTDLITVNKGTNTIALLAGEKGPDGLATGNFVDPRIVGFANSPIAVVAGDFERDKKLDLAVLNQGDNTVTIYRRDETGNFQPLGDPIPAGIAPTDLTVVKDINDPSKVDLVIGNQFGDVLVLLGNGDGTFRLPPPHTGDRVPLTVQSLTKQGPPEALVAVQKTNWITVQAPAPGNTQFTRVVTLADGTQSTLAPGAVQWAQLDQGSPFYDAVVVASGGNAILVYRGTGFDAFGNPTFAAPISYPVGTNPVSVTIQDLNGDGIPDMIVANQGSNDLSVLFGSYVNGDWVAQPGQRLKTDGLGPVAVTVRDVTGPAGQPDGIPDLVVTDGQSHTLTILQGRGQGLFDDRSPKVMNVPTQSFIEAPALAEAGGGVIPTDDGQLFGLNLNDLTVTPRPVFAPPDGAGVMAVQALSTSTLVVAQEGGAVSLLGFDPVTGAYSPEQTLAELSSGALLDPSALDVLVTATNQLAQVLVTNQGEDQVFVFGTPIALQPGPGPVAPGVPLPSPATPGRTIPEATAPMGAPLVLVLTLMADILPTGEALPTEDHLANATGAATAEETTVAAIAAVGGSGGGEEGGNGSRPLGLVKETDFGLGTDEALQQLNFTPRTDDGRLDTPMAPNPPPGGPTEPSEGPPARRQGSAEREEGSREPLSRQPTERVPSGLLGAALDGVPNERTAVPSPQALPAATVWTQSAAVRQWFADSREGRTALPEAGSAVRRLEPDVGDALLAGPGAEGERPFIVLLNLCILANVCGDQRRPLPSDGKSRRACP